MRWVWHVARMGRTGMHIIYWWEHILFDCEAIAHLRFRHLGQFFMEPSDFYDAPVFKVLNFIRNVGLIKD
jgi:hypothetical protein